MASFWTAIPMTHSDSGNNLGHRQICRALIFHGHPDGKSPADARRDLAVLPGIQSRERSSDPIGQETVLLQYQHNTRGDYASVIRYLSYGKLLRQVRLQRRPTASRDRKEN